MNRSSSNSTAVSRKFRVGTYLTAAATATAASLAIGFASPGDFARGFLAALALALPTCFVGAIAFLRLDRRASTGALMILAFALRLGFGLATENLLPVYGYPDEPQQQNGYLFDDAWRRDTEARLLAVDPRNSIPLSETFTHVYHNDQYGGIAALTIWIYRLLSPDAWRFALVILLGAWATAIGVPFLRTAIERRAGGRVALIASLIFVFYPDAIVYAGAPMREPFLIGLIAIAVWAMFTMRENLLRSALVFAGCVVAMIPLSLFVVGAALICGAVWVWAEFLIPRSKAWLTVGILVIAVGGTAALLTTGGLIETYIHFDLHTTENQSGWVEKVVGEVGGQFRTLFLGVYGLTQPVLPAILFYQPTTPYWKAVGIFRAAGWYLIVAVLFYALFSTRRIEDREKRTTMTVGALFLAGWILASSIRAGGDQWDNPRYRLIFLPLIAYYCAWGVDFALRTRDAWLARWVAIEAVFVVFFSQWYYSRYSGDAIRRFPFWRTVVYIFVASGLIFATGLIRPIRARLAARRTEKDAEVRK